MRPFSPVEVKQMEFCQQLKELCSTFDVCEKTIDAVGDNDLRSVVDVLISTNEWLGRFTKVEHEYLSALGDHPEETVVRNAEEVFERLTELHSIHSHFDVCATVVSDLKTDDLDSLSEVFIAAASRMWCLYDKQLKAGGDV